jgi:hypothetical protein
MASFTAGTSFSDGVANDVTAAKLGALVSNATPTSGFIQDRTAETVIATNDTLLIGDASDSNNLKRMTVANVMKAELTGTINATAGTITTLNSTTGTITGLSSTTGTIATLNSTTGTIAGLSSTTGTIATFNSTTGTIAGLSSTTGTIATLNSTTGTIPTLTTGTTTSTNEVVTNGTITNLSATTSTFLGTITGSTNVVNIGSGQIYKDGSGNVGIGTQNPSGFGVGSKLVVSGAITTDSINYSATFSDGTTNQLRIGHVSGVASILTDAAAVAICSAGTSEQIRFVGDKVGIRTTSPSATLHSVSESASLAAGIFQVTATSSTSQAALSVVKQDALNTTNQNFVLFLVGGSTNCGKINANGANTAAFGSTSDLRLKENVTAIPSQINNICSLKPCEFDYKDGSGHQIGFIAQEMQEVYPDVIGVDNGMLTVTGWSKTEARLVKAIQELKAKNDSLEARLQALESK